MKKILYLSILFASLSAAIFAQEKVLSQTESYYDFLALDGFTERNYLNFRTLSDSKWVIHNPSAAIWGQDAPIFNSTKGKHFKVYNPELYLSYNGKTPHGQNDGLLWQGRGLNAYFSAGVRFERAGFEITLKPEISFSQNRAFALMPSAYQSDLYKDEAKIYGYYGLRNLDAPQRFGDKAFVDFGLGDSEIRYSYKSFTVGLSNQYIWMGPAKLNPILHSNHAPSYLHFDIGVRPVTIKIGKVDFGKLEARMLVGQLKESNYFDTIPDNNSRLFTNLSLAYAPSFLKGFTAFVNRNFLCPWEWNSLFSVGDLIYIPGNMHGGRDVWDQRASLGFNYLFPKSGFEVYTEIGINDYSPGVDGYIRYPFHSLVYTSGMRKSVAFRLFKQDMRGELLLEVSNLEMSQDFQFQWSSTFYSHGQIVQGYTNRGQWLGAGNGTGGNSQYFSFTAYHTKGNFKLYAHRMNPDNDYIYQFSIGTVNDPEDRGNANYIKDFKAVIALGLNNTYFIHPKLSLYGGLGVYIEHNPLYNSISWEETRKLPSLRLEAGLTYKL